LEELHERLKTKSGGLGGSESQIAAINSTSSSLRTEESQTVIMTQAHKEQTDPFMSPEELIVSLVPHIDELKCTLEELRSNAEGLKSNVEGLKSNVEGLKGDLRISSA
jgi:chromosome segregation ATPase